MKLLEGQRASSRSGFHERHSEQWQETNWQMDAISTTVRRVGSQEVHMDVYKASFQESMPLKSWPWGSTLEKPNVHACLPEQKAQEDEQDGFCLSDFSNLTWMHLTDYMSFTLECYLQRTLNLINSFYSFTFFSLHSLGPCYIANLPALNCNIFLEYIHNFYIIQSWLLHYTIICLA